MVSTWEKLEVSLAAKLRVMTKLILCSQEYNTCDADVSGDNCTLASKQILYLFNALSSRVFLLDCRNHLDVAHSRRAMASALR